MAVRFRFGPGSTSSRLGWRAVSYERPSFSPFQSFDPLFQLIGSLSLQFGYASSLDVSLWVVSERLLLDGRWGDCRVGIAGHFSPLLLFLRDFVGRGDL